MAKVEYYCSGARRAHPLDVPNERIEGREGFTQDGEEIISRMGSMASRPGEPPAQMFCDEHQGWAMLRRAEGI